MPPVTIGFDFKSKTLPKNRYYSAYTNNEINFKKITKTKRGFQMSLRGNK